MTKIVSQIGLAHATACWKSAQALLTCSSIDQHVGRLAFQAYSSHVFMHVGASPQEDSRGLDEDGVQIDKVSPMSCMSINKSCIQLTQWLLVYVQRIWLIRMARRCHAK